MSSSRDRLGERVTEILGLLVVGLGLLDLFANVLPGVPFFLVFVIGFAVVIPIVSLLLGVDDDDDWLDGEWWDDQLGGWGRDRTGPDREDERAREGSDPDPEPSTRDAIETLRDRYARGDLTDEQFDRKLDRLLETDSPESAADWRRETRERDREAERDAGADH
jgi:hypothetical protein